MQNEELNYLSGKKKIHERTHPKRQQQINTNTRANPVQHSTGTVKCNQKFARLKLFSKGAAGARRRAL